MRALLFLIGVLLSVAASAEALPDFTAYKNATEKKSAFFGYLRPLVEKENQAIQQQRRRLLLLSKRQPRKSEQQWLSELAKTYRLPTKQKKLVPELLKRVNIVPVELALAQAAIESAWGTSRFARLGNNLFGQWCYTAGCGIVPLRRRAGSTHEVKHFKSARGSVKAYLQNLNNHRAYAKLRDLRNALTLAEKPVTAEALASTLDQYSELGDEYVQRLLRFIRINKSLMLENTQ